MPVALLLSVDIDEGGLSENNKAPAIRANATIISHDLLVICITSTIQMDCENCQGNLLENLRFLAILCGYNRRYKSSGMLTQLF